MLAKADAETAVEPDTGAPVVDDDARPRGTVTPMRPRIVDGDDGGTGDRATG